MAEIFAAVASGAGLVSLAIQLLESSQKLKGLYNAAKDAPKTVNDLCFELETLSLQLRQLERHRLHDHLDTELLDRCVAQCERKTLKVRDVVDDMTRYIRRSAAFGRLYTAFKEPEIERLLEDLERAKSSLSLTYISYCQAWNMRDSLTQASTLQRHSDLLAVQQMQLSSIHHDIFEGNTWLAGQLTDLIDQRNTSKDPQTYDDGSGSPRYMGSKARSLLRVRLPLLSGLTGRTWELAVGESQGAWTFQVHPINYRPSDTPAFHYVRAGNIVAVERLLRARELSIWDVTSDKFSSHTNLLGLAVEHHRLELCEFLLTRFKSFRNDDHLQMAATKAWNLSLNQEFAKKLIELFAGKYDMDLDVINPNSQVLNFLRGHFQDHSAAILSHQSVDLASLPLMQRFETATRLWERTPHDFLRTVGLQVSDQLAELSNAYGETALHWAARQWYNYLVLSERGWLVHAEFSDHTNFVVALMQHRHLVHALDKRGRSPLVFSMNNEFGDHPPDDDWRSSYTSIHDRATPIELWSKTLVDAGVLVPQYVARENALLESGEKGRISWIQRGQKLELRRFMLSEQRSIQLEVAIKWEQCIWEVRPPPGSLPSLDQDRSKICWQPSADDGYECFWQKTRSKKVSSTPFRLTPAHAAHTYGHDLFWDLFPGAQDDHSALASVLRRDRKMRDNERLCGTRRSSSMPPLGKVPSKHQGPNRVPYRNYELWRSGSLR